MTWVGKNENFSLQLWETFCVGGKMGWTPCGDNGWSGLSPLSAPSVREETLKLAFHYIPRRRHNLMWYASMLPGACIQEPKASFFNAVMRPSVAFWTKYFVLFVEFILSASNWLLHVPGTHANHRDKQTAMPHPHQSHQSDVGWVCQFGWQQPNNLVGYWLLHYETGIGRACAHGVCSHSSVMVWSLVPQQLASFPDIEVRAHIYSPHAYVAVLWTLFPFRPHYCVRSTVVRSFC